MASCGWKRRRLIPVPHAGERLRDPAHRAGKQRAIQLMSDRHSGRDGEGQGERAHSVQAQRTPGGHPRATLSAGRRRVRVRDFERHLSAEHSEGLRLSGCSPTASNQSVEGKVQRGARSSFGASTCAGTTFDTRGRAVCWRRRRHPDHSANARPREHSADAAVPQRDGRATAARVGGELEKPRPTASTGIRKLIGLVSLPDCPRFVLENLKVWLRGPATR